MKKYTLLAVLGLLLVGSVERLAADEKLSTVKRVAHGYGLTPEQAAEGWLAIFDGKTAFGFVEATLAKINDRMALQGGRTTTEFADFELVCDVIQGGTIIAAGESVEVKPGAVKINSRGRRGPIELKAGAAVSSMILKPLELTSTLDRGSLRGWDRRENATLPEGKRAKWTIENGVVRAQGGPGALEYAPRSGRNLFGDFVVQLVARSRLKDTNGGFFFRNEPGKTMMGYEAQLHNRWYGEGEHGYTTGGIDDRQQARAPVAVDFEPFRMTVIAHGPHLATWVNGHQTNDWTDTRSPATNPREGLRLEPGTIQLQAHDPETDLEFHGVWIREYPAAAK